MKFKSIIAAFICSITIISCSNELEQEQANDVQKLYVNSENIFAITIPNGLSNDCDHNLLIFPDFQTFRNKSESLDDENELQNDIFDQSVDPTLTDEQVEQFAIEQGFDEDGVFINFEEQFSFCSLRKHIFNAEADWLSQQGDGDWDITEDPDNHFIDEDYIRTLLNTGAEVGIGNNESFVIYKFTSLNSWIEIHNQDYTALQQINITGVVPSNNSNVIEVIPNNDPSSNCRSNEDFRRFKKFSGNTRIKMIDKYDKEGLINNAKVKTKTKYYRKKLGIWFRGKTTIGVSLESSVPLLCNATGTAPTGKIKTAKRSKVKEEWSQNEFTPGGPEIEDDRTFSTHIRRSDEIVIDIFDGHIQ